MSSHQSPLAGQSVVITRPMAQAEELALILEEHGARPVVFPTVLICPVEGQEREVLRDVFARIDSYAAVALTSANAVAIWVEIATTLGVSMGDIPYFAVGNRTAEELAKVGVTARVPSEHRGAALVHLMRAAIPDLETKSVLLPRAREGRRELIDGLSALGTTVDSPVLYETQELDRGPSLPSSLQVDWVTFTSPSAVRGFISRCDVPMGARVACIGSTTAAEAQDAMIDVDVVSSEQSVQGMVDAMAEACRIR